MIKITETSDRIDFICETADEYDNLFLAAVVDPWGECNYMMSPSDAIRGESRYWNRDIVIVKAPALPQFRRATDHLDACPELCGNACDTCSRLRRFYQ